MGRRFFVTEQGDKTGARIIVSEGSLRERSDETSLQIAPGNMYLAERGLIHGRQLQPDGTYHIPVDNRQEIK